MFFSQELGWGQTKVDELLLPIIQKMNRRRTNTSGTTSGLQGSLSEWVNVHATNNFSGNMAPRKKEVYSSRRLQQVVTEFRKKRKSGSVGPSRSESASEGEHEEESTSGPVKKQRKTKAAARGGKVGRGKGRGRGSKIAASGRKGKAIIDDDDAYTEGSDREGDGTSLRESIEMRPRPRPRPVRTANPVATDSQDQPGNSI